MAIAHLRCNTKHRANGGSAGEAVDYALGRGVHWRKAADVLAHGHVGPDLGTWEAVDRAEDKSTRRQTAKVARTLNMALPAELDHEAHVRIAVKKAEALRRRHGVAVVWSIHAPNEDGDGRNYHLHLVITTRRVDDAGNIGGKTRELDVAKTSSAHMEAWRQSWQQIVNDQLAQAGTAARIDMRSFARQERTDLPTEHLGPRITAKVRKGYHSEKHDHNIAILESRHAADALAQAERELAGLIRQRAHRAVESASGAVDASQRGVAGASLARKARACSRVTAPTHIWVGSLANGGQRQEHRRNIAGREDGHGRARPSTVAEPPRGRGGRPEGVGLPTPGSGNGRAGSDRAGMGSRPATPTPQMSAKDRDLLDRAKRDVDLPGWFATLGWVADPEHDSKLHRALRGPGGERVIVTRKSDGHWFFYDPLDRARKGTIYDAVGIYAGAASSGQQFAALRRALIAPPASVPVLHARTRSTATGSTPKPSTPLGPLGAAATKYLTSERLLSEATIEAFRHALGERGGAAVAAHNRQGGEERGPDGWRSFGGGNTDDGPARGRSAWIAAPAGGVQPTQIIVAESFIDSLSAWQMLPATERATTAVASTGGSLCAASISKLARALERIPGATVLDATDRGERTTEQRTAQLRLAVEATGGAYSRLEPPPGQKDWNDALRAAAVAQAAALMPQDDDEQTLTL